LFNLPPGLGITAVPGQSDAADATSGETPIALESNACPECRTALRLSRFVGHEAGQVLFWAVCSTCKTRKLYGMDLARLAQFQQ
jgi:hypothetical protein